MKAKTPRKFSNCYRTVITFDTKDAFLNFRSVWADGGGDGGGTLDWQTNHWSDRTIRITGTGYPLARDGTVLTPERTEEIWKKHLAGIKRRTSNGGTKSRANSKRSKGNRKVSRR